MAIRIPFDRDQLSAICRRHRVRTLAFFGSVVRDDFGPDSDVDVLVDFEAGHRVGFLGLYPLEHELSSLLGGRRIDLVSRRALHPLLRDRILNEAEVCFGKG